ncbi:hypothetical protein GWK47_044629 [Chionoecetes opilio]|uniref:Uncharacterized protein n=1 Tax=Chionoecetes opilio TaxID=41210 RepID=A0A8J4YGA6_CHIOP|nr:hypothetical protein GWK47_044629 [Chionoecetes opilio]
MDGKGDLPLSRSPLFRRGVCAHQAREEGADPVQDVYRHNVRGTVDVAHADPSAPANGPRPPQSLAGPIATRRSGGHRQGDGPAHVVRPPRSSSASPLRRGDGGRGEAGHRHAHANSGWGRRTRLAARPRRPRRSGNSAPGVVCGRPTLSASSPPPGPVTISSTSIRPSGRGGTTTPTARRRGPSPTGGLTTLRRGASPSSARSAAPSRATRKSDSTFCRSWSATGRLYPCAK